VNDGLDNLLILSVAVDPHNPSRVYAGTLRGIYETTSGGTSWRLLPLGTQFDFAVTALRIDPSHPRIVYAVTAAGVFRTADGGDHWVERDAGLTGTVSALEIDPDHPDTLYAGVIDDGQLNVLPRVYKTTNGGGRWTRLPGLRASYVIALVFQRSTHTLYASTFEGLFATRDGGATWSQSYRGDGLAQLVAAPSGALYGAFFGVGVLRSVDGGRTWNDPAPPSADKPVDQIFSLALDPLGNRLFAASQFLGLFVLDPGAAWKPANRGLRSASIYSLAVTATNPPLLFASAEGGGVFVRGAGGDFIPRNVGIPKSSFLQRFAYGFAYSPSAPRSLLIGLDKGAVATTSDTGRHWAPGPPAICLPVTVVGSSPPSTIFVSTTFSTSDGSCSASCLTKVSRDGGASFTCLDGPPRVSVFLTDPLQPATVYAAAADDVWKSTDGGLHFTLLASHLGVTISALVASPAANQTLYAGGFNGVLKSVDGGHTWSSANRGLSGTKALAVDPSNASVVYADGLLPNGERSDRRIFVSRDGGASWTPIGEGLPATVFVTSLALDPVHQVLYAGTQGASAWALDLP
jgi:photosystem II stability/assembly factor-like uncharacterized protein